MRLTIALMCKVRIKKTAYKRIRFNNIWHDKRQRMITNLRIKEDLEQRGFEIHQPQDVVASHLPPMPILEVNEADDPIQHPIENDTSHPLYKERLVHTLDRHFNRTYGHELETIMNLTKSVTVKEGLPDQILERKSLTENFLPKNQDEAITNLIQETFLFDATQKKQPRRVMVPYIDWHPVLDKMSSKVPYTPTHSYQRKNRRDYGIPTSQRNQNLMRGLFRYCDYLSVQHPKLLQTKHLENLMMRQFFERDGKLARIYLSMPYLVTDVHKLKPFVRPEETEACSPPDINPMGPLVNTLTTNVYHLENNFPVLSQTYSAPNSLIGVYLDPSYEPSRSQDAYLGLSLSMSFMLALGQARLLQGTDDITGLLKEPVTVQFIASEGKNFCFSAFQLNTMDLDNPDGVKNVFWYQDQIPLFESCEFQKARPVLSGYNPEVLQTIASMYIQNAV